MGALILTGAVAIPALLWVGDAILRRLKENRENG